MRELLERLLALQTVDLKIQEMGRGKAEIPQRIASLEEELRREEEKMAAERADLERLQKERRQKEKELEEETDRVKKAESRVFEIKTNKEYQAVLKEIEGAKKLNRQREEEILAILEKVEEKQLYLKETEQQLALHRQEFQGRISELTRHAAAYDEEMASGEREREERQRKIPPELLSRYRRLQEKRHGIAVARVVNGVCQACHMNLRPQLYIELQKQEVLIECPNCNRILFWENGSNKAKET
ncbi:MAG: hypothetical protein HY697_01485 [Deltaproteobacteria bacterium]|nr:hypothetical protein [Deltaproteobacteria bacterium]